MPIRQAALAALLTIGAVPALAAQATPAAPAKPPVPPTVTTPSGPRPDSLALARKFTQWFYAGQADSLFAYSSDETKERMGSPAAWQERADQVAVRAGAETEVIEERFRMRNGRPQYWRTANFSQMSEPFLLRWVIDGEGKITGIGLGPLSQAPPTDD